MLVGGDFNEINGQAAGYVARLNANGTPDFAFATACNGIVNSMVLQTDGKVLPGGRFEYVAGTARTGLARLRPGGALDAAFAPALQSIGPDGQVRQVAVQPDGNVLLSGYFNLRASTTATPQVLARVLGTMGQRDATFAPADSTGGFTLLVQADGRIVVGGVSRALVPTAANPVLVWRLLPSGVPDASFVANTAGTLYNVGALAVQPNGRILVGADILRGGAAQGLVRLLANGTEDPAFNSVSGPDYGVLRLLVQADGAILVAGTFRQVGRTPVNGLVRLLDANVLATSPQRSSTRLEVWPVPTHNVLHLIGAVGAQQVQLLDALSRAVLTQPITQANLTLNTAGLPTGCTCCA